MENTITIKEKKLISAIQIALAQYDVYTEEIESTLLHHIKALSIQNNQTKQLREENERLKHIVKVILNRCEENKNHIEVWGKYHLIQEAEQLLKETE